MTMDTRTWLTSNANETSEGELSAISVRLVALWGLFSSPLLLGAICCHVFLPPAQTWLAAIPLGLSGLFYLHLWVQGVRVFRAAEHKDAESWLFTVLQVAVYLSFGCAVLRGSAAPNDAWEVIGLVVSVPIALMYATHTTIAAAARVRVPATVYSGLVVAVLSSWLYLKSFFG